MKGVRCVHCDSGAVLNGRCATCGQLQPGSQGFTRSTRRRRSTGRDGRSHVRLQPTVRDGRMLTSTDPDTLVLTAPPPSTPGRVEALRVGIQRLLRERPMTQGELAERLGESYSTLAFRIDELRNQGVVYEAGYGPTPSGGRGKLLHLFAGREGQA